MRQTQIFAGSSHPELVDKICERLGSNPAEAELGKFSNGETKVQLNTSIRDQDVFIVQSGSNQINDNVMELLIMVSACKSGSAKSITAVMPYFPYSRQSKKKSHRGSITARMIANLLHQAGVNHVMTIDLHANQMQGFFHCPVDNLVAEPLLAHWIKANINDWRKAVVVSKNPGGTKRVTSLADALKLNFGIVMTDRRRAVSGPGSLRASTVLDHSGVDAVDGVGGSEDERHMATFSNGCNGVSDAEREAREQQLSREQTTPPRPRTFWRRTEIPTLEASPSPLRNSHGPADMARGFDQVQTTPSSNFDHNDAHADREDEEDPRNSGIITGRLVHGHIVDDDAPSPVHSLGRYTSFEDDPIPDHMSSSLYSTTSSHLNTPNNVHPTTPGGLGGSAEAAQSSDDEEDALRHPTLESTVTLVGNVRDRPVFLLDDMIDKSASWIAAAETVVKRGGAVAVYCFATHGLFGGDALREMEECDCIDGVVVTNAFPIPDAKMRWPGGEATKLRVLDVSRLLAEAIRRNHYGESIEQLFLHYD